MKSKRVIIALIVLVLVISSIIWAPALAFALNNDFNKFNYYLKALEYGLKGLIAYFKFVEEMFKLALTTKP